MHIEPVNLLEHFVLQHLQVSVLPEDSERRFLGYLAPGVDKHSVFPGFLSLGLPAPENEGQGVALFATVFLPVLEHVMR